MLLASSIPVMAWDWWPISIERGRSHADTLSYRVELRAVASSGKFAPFWMHTNQNGRISSSPFSGGMDWCIEKKATQQARWWDYDFAVDVTGELHSRHAGNKQMDKLHTFPHYQGQKAGFFVNRLYAHARLLFVDITAGVVPIKACNPEDHLGLSVGDFLFSGNAPAMPLVRIGIDQYTPIPGLFGYLEARGGIAHAWATDNMYIKKSFVHYKFIGGRLGGRLPVNISYELHHVAQWGGFSPKYGDLGNDLSSFKNIFLARPGGTMYNDQYNVQGNHMISQMISVIAKGNGWRTSLSWQNFIDDDFMFIGSGKNIPDGLWSIRAEQTHWPFISALEFEYLGTTDQSGPMMEQDGLVLAGNDNYYRNSVYQNGWNYYLHTIGTPFITSPLYNTNGEFMTMNNRTKVWHVGVKGDIYGFRYRTLVSFARNYHTYDSGDDYYAEKSRSTSWMLEVGKTVPQAWGLNFSLRVAGDIGNQWGNTGGVMVSISKQGVIWNSKK